MLFQLKTAVLLIRGTQIIIVRSMLANKQIHYTTTIMNKTNTYCSSHTNINRLFPSSPISFISRTDSAAIHWHSVESICLFPNCCISSYLTLVVFVLTTSKHNKNLIYPCHFNLFYRIVGSHQILGCVYNVTVSVINLFSLISVRICIQGRF